MSDLLPDETEGANGSEEPGATSWNWQATVISMCAAAGITECDDIVISDVLEGIKSGRCANPSGRCGKPTLGHTKRPRKKPIPTPTRLQRTP